MKPGSGGLWNLLALFEKKVIVAEAKPVELAALGTELGEANESKATKAEAVAKATITDADKKIVVGQGRRDHDSGRGLQQAAKRTAKIVFMKSFLAGCSCTTTAGEPRGLRICLRRAAGRQVRAQRAGGDGEFRASICWSRPITPRSRSTSRCPTLWACGRRPSR